MTTTDEVLEFWFGARDEHGLSAPEQRKRWFMKDDDFDREIATRFAATYREIADGRHEDWLETPQGRLAYIIVLDQFSRNMFRGSGDMYAQDARALTAANDGIERGDDNELRGHHKAFLYMPLMHAEDLAMQQRCESLFRGAAAAHQGPAAETFAMNASYAEKHRVIVERFGRFPHRNELLDRASTPEEEAFLKEPGSSF